MSSDEDDEPLFAGSVGSGATTQSCPPSPGNVEPLFETPRAARRAPPARPPPRRPDQRQPAAGTASMPQLDPTLLRLLEQLGLQEHTDTMRAAEFSMQMVCRANPEDWHDIGISVQDGASLRRAAREAERLPPDPEPDPEPELFLEPVDSPEEVILPVTFEQPGKLGIRFRAKRDDVRDELAWVHEVLPGGLADKDGRIVPGLVLVTINGAAAADLTFAEQTSVQRLGVRPLELGFRTPQGEVREPQTSESRERERAAADLVDTACQVATDRPALNEAVREWKQHVVQAERNLADGIELTEASAEALLARAKALMDYLKQSLESDPTVRAAIFLYEPSIQNTDDKEEPMRFEELQARVAAAHASSAALEWLQEHPVPDEADDSDAGGERVPAVDVYGIGSGSLNAYTASGPIAAMGTILSDEQVKTVRNVVAAWVEETVLGTPMDATNARQQSQLGQHQEDGTGSGGRAGALLWRCCGVTMRTWLPAGASIEATLAGVRNRSQSDMPFEIRSKLVADDGWQSAVDELNKMDGGGRLGAAAAAATAVGQPRGEETGHLALQLVDPPLPPAEMLSTVLAAVAAIYAAPTSTASKLDAIGADDLMPVLSYVLAQCSVGGHLGICAEWIQKLADPPLLMDGQPAYYFITFCSALDYLARYKDQPDSAAAAQRGEHSGKSSGGDELQVNASVHGMGAPVGIVSKQSVTRRGVIECGLLLAHFANISTPTPRRRPQKKQEEQNLSSQLEQATSGESVATTSGSIMEDGTASKGGSMSPSPTKNFRETVTEIFGHSRAEPLEFEEPSEEHKSCDGKLLVGKRVYVVGIGVGKLTDFHKVLQGSSSHSLQLESDGRVVVAKLQRKMCPTPKRSTCSCCPDKLPWLIARQRMAAPDTPVPEGVPPESTRQALATGSGRMTSSSGRLAMSSAAPGSPFERQQGCQENILGVCTVVKRRLAGVALREAPAESSAEVGRLGPGEEAHIIRMGPAPYYEPWDSGKHGSHWLVMAVVNHRPVVRTVEGFLTLLPDTLVAQTEPLTLPTRQWANDESTPDCRGCQTEFGVFVRRHHCRYCGQLFCDDCSINRYPLASRQRLDAASPDVLVDERVCTNCFSFLESWVKCVQTPYAPNDFEDIQMCSLENKVVDMRTPLGPESYEPLCVLGVGGVGKVFLARFKDKNEDQQQLWAVKTMNKVQLVQRNQHLHAMEEMRLMRKLTEERSSCPYLLPLCAAFHSDSMLFLVMPFMQGGDLHQAICRQPNQKLEEPAVRFIAAEITLALEALHSLDIVFRDLKPMNVLLTTAGHVQLSDFGLAKEGVSQSMMQTTCGTPLYMSPEQVQHATMTMHEEERGGYSFAVDWWALGTLIFEALTGQPPFVARQMGNIMHKIANKQHSFTAEDEARLSEDAKSIVAALLQKDADRRLGAEGTADVQAHPWFAAHIDFAALSRMEVAPVYVPTLDIASSRASDRTASGELRSNGSSSFLNSVDVASGDKSLPLSGLLGCFDLEVTCAHVDRAVFQSSSGPTQPSAGNETPAARSPSVSSSPLTQTKAYEQASEQEQRQEEQAEFWANYTYTRDAGSGTA